MDKIKKVMRNIPMTDIQLAQFYLTMLIEEKNIL